MPAKSVVSATVLMGFCCIIGAAPGIGDAKASDHREFDAVLQTPFHADSKGMRTITLHFHYPDSEQTQQVRWQLELLRADGRVLRRWKGRRQLAAAAVAVPIRWNGRARF
ncbi:MAG TPA: phosphotransferase, partial [Duganella sp.]|nr:phosphotransferase [Duganella sp.]